MKTKEIKVPRINKRAKKYFIGKLMSVNYKTEKGNYYKHNFKNPQPDLLTDGKNFFIAGNRKDLYFDPERGIIN